MTAPNGVARAGGSKGLGTAAVGGGGVEGGKVLVIEVLVHLGVAVASPSAHPLMHVRWSCYLRPKPRYQQGMGGENLKKGESL